MVDLLCCCLYILCGSLAGTLRLDFGGKVGLGLDDAESVLSQTAQHPALQ